MFGGIVIPTDEEVQTALNTYGMQVENGCWIFSSPQYPHTQHDAENIVRICLMLGLPVTDVGTSEMFLALVNRIVALEARL